MNRQLLILLLLFSSRLASAQPVANFTASPRTGCAPMAVSFTSTSTGSPTSYSWNFGNGNTSTVQNPVAPYTTPGVYTVTLTVSNASGSNTKTQSSYITVNQVPSVSLSATPVIVCPGSPVSFSSAVTWNSAGTGTYVWDFGDGNSSASATPVHRYTNGGTYTVKLTAINSVSCPNTDTEANLIFVYPRPRATFSATDTAVCSPTASTTFTASTTAGTGPFTYSWDFGDGSGFGSGSSVAHAYSSVGSYTVKLYLTDANGCQDSVIRPNYIRRRSLSNGFTAPASVCVGASVTTTNTTGSTVGPMSYTFGDGSLAISGTSATYTYTTAGTYTITQIATEGGCAQTGTQTIVVNPQPSSAFTYTPAQPCPSPIQIQFNASTTTAGSTYSWNFGDGFSGTGASPAHWYMKDWIFKVTLGVTNASGCSSSSTQTLAIHPLFTIVDADVRSGCIPMKVTFDVGGTTRDTNGVPYKYPYPAASITWNFGDGSTGSGKTPTHTYTTIGLFYAVVTYTTTNGCTYVDSILTAVGVKPTAKFGAHPRVVCVNAPIYFLDSSTSPSVPLNTWIYDFGDGSRSVSQNPVYSYSRPGTYTVVQSAGINGCYDTMTKVNYIVVNDPKASMRVRTDCTAPLQVSFADSSIGATSHMWYFGDGTSSSASHPTHTYPSAGNYTAMLTVFNSNTGCADTLRWPLNLNPLSLNFSASKTSLCKGDSITLTASTSGGGVPQSYAWWVGTAATPTFGFKSTDPTITMTMRNSGLMNVALEVVDQNNCAWRFQRNAYILVGGPNVSFTAAPPVACLPYGNVTFTETSTHPPGLRSASRTWDYGDGSPPVTTTSASSVHNYTTTGTYGIILKVTDNIGCTDSALRPNSLHVSDPRAVWGTTSNRACENAPYYYFNSSTGSNLTYLWSFGDGNTSTQANPMHVYKAIGTYNVQLIVTDDVGCKDTMSKVGHVTVNGKPTAAFSMSDTIKICPPMVINFTDRSTGATRWNWSFGTGGSSTIQNPSHIYTTPKIYSIRLVATNAAGCSDTTSRTARLMGYAGVLSYSPLTGCAPLTVNFRANDVDHVPGFIYHFGDGTIGASTATTITHTYKRAGTYLPSITLTDNLGCTASSAGLDPIKVDGVLSGFTFAPFPACDRGTIQFIDTSKGAFGPINPPSWSFHDGTSSSAPSPTKTYSGPGTYAVTLYTSTASGCRDTLRSSVVFHALPKIDAGPDTTICRGDTAILRPRGGVSYQWSPAGTLSCAGCTNPGAFPQDQTRYIVTGTDTNGCRNIDSVTVKIRIKVEASVSPDVEICSGKTTTLNASGGSTYEWSPPGTLHGANTASPVAFPSNTVRYMVISRLAACIADTDYVNVVVHQTPSVDAGKSRTIIAGETTQLEGVGSGPISTWEWSPPEGLSCIECYNPEASPKRSTLYTAKVSSDFGCTATDTVRVIVLCDQSQVFLPNTFTPEGNGVNDIFYPRGKGIEMIGRFRIYNRWGELIFERTNMQVDDRSMGWDGRKEGRLLSPDIYVYTVEATCDTGEPIKWQGDVMLLR